MTFRDLVLIQKEVCCPPFEFRVGCFECGPLTCLAFDDQAWKHTWWVEACLVRKDSVTDVVERGYGGPIAVSSLSTRDAMVKKFFVAARDYAEHEVREAFEWKGHKVLGPHIPLDDLWEIT